MDSLIYSGFSHTAICTDDALFYRNVNLEECIDKITSDAICYQNRLGLNINYCHSRDIDTPNPGKTKYKYVNYLGDLGYAGSVDFGIFRTKDLAEIKKYNYKDIWSFESLLNYLLKNNKDKPYIAMPEHSTVVTLVANVVNPETSTNRVEETISVKDLNDAFLHGKRIKMPSIQTVNSCHINFKYILS